jgi:hypothetical protein
MASKSWFKPVLQGYGCYPMGKQCRSRSSSTSLPSDQNLYCLLLDALGYFRPRSNQCRSDDMNLPADLDLPRSHTIKVKTTSLMFEDWQQKHIEEDMIPVFQQ